jgi:regulatory protein
VTGAQAPDRAQREKQLAAMLRAGHPLDSARELIDAASVEAAEQWAGEDACD